MAVVMTLRELTGVKIHILETPLGLFFLCLRRLA